jgi:hypothetical protein
LLVEHINKMRSISMIGGTMAVMVLEANLGFESQHLLHSLKEANISRWMALSEGQGGGLGLLTTAGRKEEYALLLREAMRVGKIGFNDDFFSISMGKVEAKKRLKEELLNYSVIKEQASTKFGKGATCTVLALAFWARLLTVVHRARRSQDILRQARWKARRHCAGTSDGAVR